MIDDYVNIVKLHGFTVARFSRYVFKYSSYFIYLINHLISQETERNAVTIVLIEL